MKNRISVLLAMCVILKPAFALEPACEAILKASEARIEQPAWHSVTEMNTGMRIEVIKANNAFYRNTNGKWTILPINVDETERKLIARVRNGESKLTQCAVVGSESIDGIPVTVFSSRTEMKGSLAEEAKLYVGRADNLPYKQTGHGFKAIYQYKGVPTPNL